MLGRSLGQRTGPTLGSLILSPCSFSPVFFEMSNRLVALDTPFGLGISKKHESLSVIDFVSLPKFQRIVSNRPPLLQSPSLFKGPPFPSFLPSLSFSLSFLL